ncbi:MAG TPA: cation:proton antiporter [Chitinophagales bacterium]|nr:cation:proton antiporter [Chitinophagales bacterium]
MVHLPHLISDLGLILVVAGITTLIFKRIRQPLVLGYILAGLLVGPHISLFPTVADEEGVKVWSEIGVIILLFTLGLEFSFKKLAAVGGSVTIAAVVEIVLMIAVGFITGQALGWSLMDSIFLGAILSMSSTTIIIRAFEEVGARTQKFATLVFGILIVEDLVAILLMVLLSTLAVSREFAGSELFMQILKLLFFLIVWFIGGIFFIPTFLKQTRRLMNDKTLLIVSLALCLLMVILAVKVGFSAALGAFIMGSILAETVQAEKIEHLIKPVKDLFAAVFFVSVGMMLDPQVLVDYAVPVLIITFITIFGKFVASGIGVLLGGQPLKHSVQAGLSLAQIGEFSFIIASLGVTLKVTSGFLYPISVAASIVTTLTTPFLIKHSEAIYLTMEKRLPARWVSKLNRYSAGAQHLQPSSDWKKLIQAYGINTIVHTVIIIAIILLSSNFIYPFISELANGSGEIITVSFTLLLMVPFIWALAVRRIKKETYTRIWLSKGLRRVQLVVIDILRIAIAIFLVGFLFQIFFSPMVALIAGVIAIGIATVFFSRRLQNFYERIEERFLSNLNERERQKAIRSEIAPWDMHLTDFEVIPETSCIGKPLEELAFREKYGINIALIERGNHVIPLPSRYERLYPGDKISVIGTDAQLDRFKELFEHPEPVSEEDAATKEINLQTFTIGKNSFLRGQSLRNSGIREKAHALVVGIERNGQRITNPESHIIFEEGDVVWVVGNKNKLEAFLKGK